MKLHSKNYIRHRLTDFQFAGLALAAGFISQALIAEYRATIYGRELHQMLLTATCFGGGCLVLFIIHEKFKSFFQSGHLLLSGAITIALGAFSFLSFLFSVWVAKHNRGLLMFPLSSALGLVAIFPYARMPEESRTKGPWVLSTILALLGTLLANHFILKSGFLKTSEVLSSAVVLLSFLVLFVNGNRNGWIALVCLVLTAFPLLSTRFLANSTNEMSIQINAKRISILETESDPNFPGIPQHSLYVNGFARFISSNEQNFYNCLVNIPDMASQFGGHPIRSALVIGGGSGIAARNLINIARIKQITVLEPDPIAGISSSELKLRIYNLDSLKSPRVKIIEADPSDWISKSDETYDLILIDWPLDSRESSGRYITAEFFSRLSSRLGENGWMAIGAGPASQLSKSSSVLRRTLTAVGYNAHLYVDTKSNHAIVLVTEDLGFEMKPFARHSGMMLQAKAKRSRSTTKPACHYSPDFKEDPYARPNTMSRSYAFSETPFQLDYSGPRSILLAD
jgi:spermidine synthase